MPKILIIDDDDRLCDSLSEFITRRGFEVTTARDAATGLRTLEGASFDAVVLDVMLPDQDGFEVCRQIRARSDLPILMLTARGDDEDRIVGLEIGADDYVPKPFNPRELLARIRAILRRTASRMPERDAILRFGRLEIDLGTRRANLDGRRCSLTSYQFDVLRALAENAGEVMSREELLKRIGGEDRAADDRSIDVHVSRIRAAIEEEPKTPRRILTVRGLGYVFTRGEGEGAMS